MWKSFFIGPQTYLTFVVAKDSGNCCLPQGKWTQYLMIVFSDHPTNSILITGYSDVDRIVEKANIKDLTFILDYHLLPVIAAFDPLHLVNSGTQRRELLFFQCDNSDDSGARVFRPRRKEQHRHRNNYPNHNGLSFFESYCLSSPLGVPKNSL